MLKVSPVPVELDRSALLLDACRYLTGQIVDLSEQAAMNPDDRDEVLLKLDGLAETIRETREQYVAALPQPF